ncbi:Prefoldin subunit 6 [Armadillidium nasatum]|uniref:Probable prefoldin subunit 6 n=1 Tax=Armadillidium nasatum TaxID=96803 RepID=A0A5N5T956_9CRUS|nr:Prefoldin subunit 6 [Armadillidium nasatum]
MGPEAIQKKFEEEIEVFKKLQKDLSKTTVLRSRLDGQLNENKIVKEELDLLEGGAVVYKLIGPVLVKQDLEEAKQNVEKRIDYISQEMKRHDSTLNDLEKEQETKKDSLAKLQTQLQQLMVKAAAQQK